MRSVTRPFDASFHRESIHEYSCKGHRASSAPGGRGARTGPCRIDAFPRSSGSADARPAVPLSSAPTDSLARMPAARVGCAPRSEGRTGPGPRIDRQSGSARERACRVASTRTPWILPMSATAVSACRNRGVPPLADLDPYALSARARERYRACDVPGLVVHDRDGFFRRLGENDPARLRDDPRHPGVRIVEGRTIPVRLSVVDPAVRRTRPAARRAPRAVGRGGDDAAAMKRPTQGRRASDPRDDDGVPAMPGPDEP